MEVPSPIDIATATSRVTAEPAPVLFVDTCALLDIVRLPLRDRSGEAERVTRAALRTIVALESDDRNLWLVVSPPVVEEYQRNVSREHENLWSRWQTLDNNYQGTHEVARALDVAVPLPPRFEASLADFHRQLERLPERIIERALHIEPDDAVRLRAMTRAEGAIAPSQRGKESLGDCVLTEHVIEFADQLGVGAPMPLVLLTSNTEDFYATGGTSSPRPPLDDEFGERELTLVKTWDWACSVVGV